MANKIIIADNIFDSCSHIKLSNEYSNKNDASNISINRSREYLIPQPSVDSQKISHFSTGIGSNTKTHNSTNIKRIV